MLNSRSYDDLVEPFRSRAIQVVDACRARGLDMVVASTLRDLESQASLYRMNRNRAQIEAKIAKFRQHGFGFLADVIIAVGPQPDDGKGIRTNAGPGESWHNYGLAADCYPIIHGKLAVASDPSWKIYGEEVERFGLQWAGRWKSFREMPHMQLGSGSNPLRSMPREQIASALSRWIG